MMTLVASRPDRAGIPSPPADGAERGENRSEDLGARHSGQWNPTDAECMQRAQIRLSQRWQRTPARFSGCQWQASASGGESIYEP
jgi:ABC-type phosphonate transport system ATPase subunit